MNRFHALTTVLLCLFFTLHTYSTTNSLFANRLYVDVDAPDPADGSTWDKAYTDLQAALMHARNDNSIIEIWVAEGTYYPTAGTDRSLSFELVGGVKLYGGFEGTEDELEERDVSAFPTILSGDIGAAMTVSDNSYHVVRIDNLSGDDTTIDGFTITSGNATGTLLDQYGGGLLLTANGNGVVSVPQISNCIFQANLAGYGGALAQYADNNARIGTITSFCQFRNNTANIQGGALYHYKGTGTALTVDYRGSIFSENLSIRGGVLYSNGSNGMTVDPITAWNAGFFNCIFNDNSASFAGVFYLIDAGSSTHLLVRNATMYNNQGSSNSDVLLLNLTSSANIGNCIIIECDDPFDDFNFLPNQLTIQNSIIDYGLGAGSYLDPEFVDVTNRNFRLNACSPVIDQGINFGTPANFDPDKNPRQYGSKVDIGAYEFVGTSIQLPIPAGASVMDAAEEEFTDINGWTHYYNCTSGQLLLSIFKDGQDIGTIGQGGFEVNVTTTSEYGNTATDLTSADYRNGLEDWLVMNRYWQVLNAASLATPVKVRFYFDDQDYADVQDAVAGIGGLLADPRDLNFFKVGGSGVAPLDTDVMAKGGTFSEYTYADTSSMTNWTNGNFNGQRYAEFVTSSFSGGGGGYLNQTALPVELLAFKGELVNKYIQLNWETSAEENSDHFVLEKSIDAQQFFPVSQHAAQGFSSIVTSYATIDQDPFLGANYYRLKQVDRDGQYQYSDVIVVYIHNKNENPLLFPNPTSGNLTLQLPEALEGEVKMEVWDALRRVVWERTMQQGHSQLIPIDLEQLEPGLYVLKVRAKRYRTYSPFVVQKR